MEYGQFARALVKDTEQALVFASTRSPNAPGDVFVGTQGIAFTRRLIARQALIQSFGESARFVSTLSSLSMRDIGAAVAQQAAGAVAERGALLFAAAGEAATRKVGMANKHGLIAQEAQTAVYGAYSRRYTRPSYRQNDPSRLSGKMEEALQDKSLIIAQRDGLLMFNRSILDQKAAHWYRLNFGAQPAGRQKISKSYKLMFEGTNLGELSLKNNRASGRFSMPAGVFLDPGGKVVSHDEFRRGIDQFYTLGAFYRSLIDRSVDANKIGLRPKETKAGRRGFDVRAPREVPTRGIVGGLFFDAGLKVVANKLPVLYSTLLDEWIAESEQKGTGPVAKVLARPI